MANKGCSYKGTEPSPKGFGECAHLTPVGTRAEGTDGNIWVVKQDRLGRHVWKHDTIKATPKVKSPRVKSPKAKSPKAKSPKVKSPKAKSPKAKSPRRKNRKNSPQRSATLYSEGAVRLGLDRRTWKVTRDSRGAKRWMKV
jgi:hypothetical protein